MRSDTELEVVLMRGEAYTRINQCLLDGTKCDRDAINTASTLSRQERKRIRALVATAGRYLCDGAAIAPHPCRRVTCCSCQSDEANTPPSTSILFFYFVVNINIPSV